MINTPTVLILGAGSSKPYGLPTGAELRQRLCWGSDPKSELARHVSSLFSLFEPTDVAEFCRAFERSNVASIDAFLARNLHFSDVGKACIAYVLASMENPDKLVQPDDRSDNWYFWLWNRLLEGIHSAVDHLGLNRIKVISFNYDRSLEQFLFMSIKNTFALSDVDTLQAMANIPILHVYGTLGKFGGSGQSVRPYQPADNAMSFGVAAAGIRVIPEVRDDDELLATAQSWIAQADRIAFLGFGFDELNVRRLGVKSLTNGTRPNGLYKVIASTFEMTDAEVDIAHHQATGNGAHWTASKTKCLLTLRENAWFFQ